MKRIGIFGLCFVAMLVVSATSMVSVSVAEVLFSTIPGTFHATGGAAVLNGIIEVKCASTSSSGIINTRHLGLLKVEFEKCTTQFLGSHECTGTKPASPRKGNITYDGTFHLGTARKVSTETAHAAILVLITEPSPLEFECAGVGTVKVRGSVIGLLQKKFLKEPLVPEEALLHSVTAFEGSGKTQSDKEFLLSLTLPAEELMTNQELTCEISTIQEVCAEIGNSEITEVSPAGISLISG